jgi:hypothetical protein
VDNVQTQKSLRFIVLMLVLGAIFLAGHALAGATHEQKTIRIGATVAAFLSIPVLYRFWPVTGEKSISPRIWLIFLALLTLGLVMLDLPDSWVREHPRLTEPIARLGSALGGWLLPVLIVLVGAGLRLLRTRKTS